MNQELKERSPAVKKAVAPPKTDLISHQLVKYLEDRGVEYIFGLCGHTNIAVLAALAKSRVKFINTRHEQVAAHMADGYARAKRTTAVVLSHLGPGLTNASTGVANAALDSIPMVVIAGDVPSLTTASIRIRGPSAAAPRSSRLQTVRKRAWRVERPDLFPEILEKGSAGESSSRQYWCRCRWHLSLQSTSPVEAEKQHQEAAQAAIDEEVAEKIVRTLGGEDPVVYAGRRRHPGRCGARVKEFFTHLALPVAHSLMGKGVLRMTIR